MANWLKCECIPVSGLRVLNFSERDNKHRIKDTFMTFSPRFLLTTFYPIRLSDFVSSNVVVPYYPPPLSLFTGVSELHAFGAEARKQVTMISFKWEPISIRLTISRIIGTTPFHSAWTFRQAILGFPSTVTLYVQEPLGETHELQPPSNHEREIYCSIENTMLCDKSRRLRES
jgi:hypothetical protein